MPFNKSLVSCHTYVVYIIKYNPYQILSSIYESSLEISIFFILKDILIKDFLPINELVYS